MRFKKLELLGFKSFAEPTEFIFEPGVTAVVGPNGSGKSNFADALKWVLGEQSARELRGGRMEDLIFNGSDRREPIHFAEVSLTIDNSEKKLPTEYAEVTVSRRLFRSGESEYLLNRTPVRLKDIQELFMGTGVGTSAYSLFEQGRIEQIISARPEERRTVFEEAAGITKFKSQKREALRRLEETEDNLSRAGDVIAEVKRQIQSLERQVRRAKAYQEQFEQLKGMEVRLARGEMRRIDAEWEGKDSSLREIRGRAGELEQRSGSQEGRLSDARQAVAQADQGLAQAREGFLGASHRLEGSVATLQMNRERIAEGQQRAAALREELAQAQGRLGELRRQMEETGAAIAQQEGERRAREGRIAECQGRLDQCARQAEQAQRLTAEARDRLLEVTGSQVQVKNSAVRLRQEVARLETRAGRLQQDSAKVAAEREEAGSHLRELEEELGRHRAQLSELERQRGAGQEELAATESSLDVAQQEMYGLEQELTRFESQLEMLRGMLASHEGYSSGVKALLTAVDEGRLVPEGIAGVLAELIQVDPADAAAVDAGLGRWAEAVVVSSGEVAERCRLFLERSRSGRVLFLIRDRAAQNPPSSVPALGADNDSLVSVPGAVLLSQRVGITPHLAPLLELLLAETWRVPDRETAQRLLASRAPDGTRLVTPQGEMFTLFRALLGPVPSEEGMIVGRISRLQTMEAAHASAGSRLEQARCRFASLRDQRARQTEALVQLEQALQGRTRELQRADALSGSARAVVEKLDEERRVLSAEGSEVDAELRESRAQAERWERELAVRDGEMEGLQEQMRQAQETIAQASRTREELSVALATGRAEMASFEEVQSSRRRSLQVLEQTVGSLEQQTAARREELARQEERCAQLELSCRDLEGELARLEQEKISAQGGVAVAQAERERLLAAAVSEEREFLAARRQLEQIQAQLHGQEMDQAKLRFRQEQIASRLRQLYSVELSLEGAPERELTPEELEELKGQAEELSEKLQRMGPVNLGSIEEERELQNRYEYLTAQQADLLKAKEDLHQALTKINRTTRALFRETFQAIQREFQGTFKQLFGGGEARLVLMDEEDVLESGIEIIARPPGKPLQPISLLSGGEKALTTIALLFAIFRIKPSPFCLLDEIDAPLDEPNVDRFTRALKEFLKDSQFVIITHNKKTMTMADVLYGVTMQEMGVSKIVSVKFKQGTNGSGNGNGAPAGPTPPSPRRAESPR
ncbi:MAG: chromosome segregation protein SMC [Candidatus Omnitrophica bacterium]|nr:chromosome segregation protein SMC [Candidatus Omnitrophota bacterium]